MSRTPLNPGRCIYCNAEFKKRAMITHLKKCLARKESSFGGWLVEIDAGDPYWMHLLIPGDSTLAELDKFLRDIWLECCGHLSEFNIAEESYSDGLDDSNTLSIKVDEIFTVQQKIEYQYDFGSTTGMLITVLSKEDTKEPNKITLQARNNPPFIECVSCQKEDSTEICVECVWDGEGTFCDTCFQEHGCDEDLSLPVVNSPRTGICGYEG